MNTATALFEETYSLLERGWCQNHEAEDEHGRLVEYLSPDARCFCLAAAFFRAARNQNKLDKTGKPARFLVRAVGLRNWTGYNDHARRTKEEVLATVKRARELSVGG
jgi:hypothetical protein